MPHHTTPNQTYIKEKPHPNHSKIYKHQTSKETNQQTKNRKTIKASQRFEAKPKKDPKPTASGSPTLGEKNVLATHLNSTEGPGALENKEFALPFSRRALQTL